MELNSEKRGELMPVRLGEKLKRIRENNNLSQGKMLLIINPKERSEHNRSRVSQYEKMTRVPSLVETRNYAQFAGVPVEVLINDDLDLPANLREKSVATSTSSKKSIKGKLAKKNSRKNRSKIRNKIRANAVSENSNNTSSSDPEDQVADSANDPQASSPESNTNMTSSSESDDEKSAASKDASGSSNGKPATAEPRKISDVPFLVEAVEQVENLSINLPLETLDKLDDLQLEILKLMPRRLRRSVNVSDLINFAVNILLINHEEGEDSSLIVIKTKLLVEDFNNNKNAAGGTTA